jgi:hypothetical protein
MVMQVAGGFLNYTAIKANGGVMPVWSPARIFDNHIGGSEDPSHVVLTWDSKYILLTDIIPSYTIMDGFKFEPDMRSFGDLLMQAGDLILVLFLVYEASRKIHSVR